MTDKEQPKPTEENIQDLVSEALGLPMFILSLIMLGLLIINLTVQLSPSWHRIVLFATSIVWWIFVLEYALEVFLSNNRLQYIKAHWLDALFVFLPFLRVFEVLKVVRSIRLLRAMPLSILGRTYVTTRRGLNNLRKTLGRRSLPYVLSATVIVELIGSLMMFFLERNAPGSVIRTYGDAMWWTVGLITTIGTELHPVTAEGRIISVIIMTYGMGIFGYVAAALASYFVQVDTKSLQDLEPVGIKNDELKGKIDQLLAELEKHKNRE